MTICTYKYKNFKKKKIGGERVGLENSETENVANSQEDVKKQSSGPHIHLSYFSESSSSDSYVKLIIW